MEGFISTQNGVGGICVLLTIQVLLRVVQFLWAIREKKESLSESSIRDLTHAVRANTLVTQHLEHRMQTIEKAFADMVKVKTDVRRFYSAIKQLSGDQWPAIRDELMKDEFTQ